MVPADKESEDSIRVLGAHQDAVLERVPAERDAYIALLRGERYYRRDIE